MLKTICLALICLFGMTAALALRPNSTSAPAVAPAAGPADEPGDIFSVNTSAKGDKLSIVLPDDEVKKVVTKPIQVTPIQVESKPQPARAQITNWHWHAGSKTITRK